MDNENWTFSPGGTPKQVVPDEHTVEPSSRRPMPPPPPVPATIVTQPPLTSRIGYPQASGLPRNGNRMATASLVLGILGFLVPLLSVLALIFGPIGISKANQGASGRGLAIAGLVLGIVGTLAMFYAASNPTSGR